MADSMPVFRSPVVVEPTGSGALSLTDLSAAGKLVLDAGGSSAGPPVETGFARRAGSGILFSVSPGRWFALTSGLEAVGEVEVPEGASAVDVSHVKAVVRVAGPGAAAALEKVCALDFDDRFMPDGFAGRTSVAKTVCELVRLDREGVPAYLIMVGRSLGAYLFDALVDAAEEFGGVPGAWDGDLP